MSIRLEVAFPKRLACASCGEQFSSSIEHYWHEGECTFRRSPLPEIPEEAPPFRAVIERMKGAA